MDAIEGPTLETQYMYSFMYGNSSLQRQHKKHVNTENSNIAKKKIKANLAIVDAENSQVS